MPLTLDLVSITVTLPDEIARRVEAVAIERGTSVEVTAVNLLTIALSDSHHEPQSAGTHRMLAFAGIGASEQPKGAAKSDEMLAEGFGN